MSQIFLPEYPFCFKLISLANASSPLNHKRNFNNNNKEKGDLDGSVRNSNSNAKQELFEHADCKTIYNKNSLKTKNQKLKSKFPFKQVNLLVSNIHI
jgi:hypothetical protein